MFCVGKGINCCQIAGQIHDMSPRHARLLAVFGIIILIFINLNQLFFIGFVFQNLTLVFKKYF
jgi:hypothetical protein